MKISTEIIANGKRYSVIDTHGESIPGNTGGKDDEYFAVLSDEPHVWYELKKQQLDVRFDLLYLEEKLMMKKQTARDFIPQFNAILV
jgi:hypothetical protein